jgi:dipeptidyl aminopeptidase/acylaminoacyl peptidase
MLTVEYAPGRLADVFGDRSQPPVLLWHGMQTDARHSVRTLAEELARRGLGVVAPDWNSHAADGGRADLLQSVDFTRRNVEHPDALVLVGWSMGGVAAAGLTVHADDFGVALAHTVCLAGAFAARDPISGGHVADDVVAGNVGVPFTLLHGTADDVVPVASSETFAASLKRMGWPVELVELAADHGSIAGARYDPDADRYIPADDARTLDVVAEVATRIAAVSPS